MIGILWADSGNPVSVASVSSYDFYSAVYSLIAMIPLHIVVSTFEVGGQIRSVLMSPCVSLEVSLYSSNDGDYF